MNGSILRKYGVEATFNVQLVQPDGVDFEPAATFAAGDLKIMKDEGAEANTDNLPTDEGQGYSLVLTATEMEAARIVVYLVDQTNPKVWLDTAMVIETYGNASGQHAMDFDTVVPAAGDLWGVLLSAIGGGNTIGSSLKNFLNGSDSTALGGVIRRGTAQAGASSTITLDAGASGIDDTYNGNWVSIKSGTGLGQTRLIPDYVGSSKVASVDPPWVTNPDATSVFVITPSGAVDALKGHTVQTGDSFARLGAPAGASVSADLVTVDAVVDAIKSVTDLLPNSGALNDLALILADTNTEGVALSASVKQSIADTLLTRQMTESYNADGTPPTLAQALCLLISATTEFAISGTTITAKKLDGSTTAATFTLDDSSNPTSRTRAT